MFFFECWRHFLEFDSPWWRLKICSPFWKFFFNCLIFFLCFWVYVNRDLDPDVQKSLVPDPQQVVIYRTQNQCCGSALAAMRIGIRIRIQHFLSMNADPCGSATLHQIPANCTSYFTHITDNARKEKCRELLPVNKRLLVQGVRSGGEEGGLPRLTAGGGTPVPVLLTQLLPKQRCFFSCHSITLHKEKKQCFGSGSAFTCVPRRLFVTALQWLAIAQGPKIS